MRLRVATYNIHGGIGVDARRDYRRIGQHLARLHVDIALLQEVDARQAFTRPEFNPSALCQQPQQILVPAPAVSSAEGWYGNALLSRFPVIESHSVDVSLYGLEPRNIQLAKVDVNGRILRVINTHKGLKSGERRTQFAKLHEQLVALVAEPEPIVLGGDFNEWQFFSRSFRAIDEVMRPLPVGATFPSRWPLFRLDRLWVSPALSRPTARVIRGRDARQHSDHCPVIADIELA